MWKYIFFGIFLLFVMSFFGTVVCNDNPNIGTKRIESNVEFANLYKQEFILDSSYRRMANVMRKIHYNGDLYYKFYSTPGDQHKLIGPYGCLNDSFPWVEREMRMISGEHNWCYRVYKEDDIISLPIMIAWYHNRFDMAPTYVYTLNLNKLANQYSDYIICDTIDDDYNGCWILRLEKNWYLVSPDSSKMTRSVILE